MGTNCQMEIPLQRVTLQAQLKVLASQRQVLVDGIFNPLENKTRRLYHIHFVCNSRLGHATPVDSMTVSHDGTL